MKMREYVVLLLNKAVFLICYLYLGDQMSEGLTDRIFRGKVKCHNYG